MKKYYYERRKLIKPDDRIAVDIAKHLQTRHTLGTALVICDNPHALMSAMRKQWLRLIRHRQRQRASTLNAEEILRHTQAIVRMQSIQFSLKALYNTSGSIVYFQTPDSVEIPTGCMTVYATTQCHIASLTLPDSALIVNYSSTLPTYAPLLAKTLLEEAVTQRWKEIAHILQRLDINPRTLSLEDSTQQEVLDQALDMLIDSPDEFLTKAFAFQQAVDLAQPLQNISEDTQRRFEAVTRLAYRVNTLTPKARLNRLANALIDNDNYFLRDPGAVRDDAFLITCTHPIYRSSATI